MTYKKKAELAIQEIAQKIQTHYKPNKIVLFGSYAYGKPNRDSDIDMFIVRGTTKRRIDRFVEVKKLVYDANRRIPFSPIVYTPKEVKQRLSLGDDFVKEILDKGRVLYAK